MAVATGERGREVCRRVACKWRGLMEMEEMEKGKEREMEEMEEW
jgi:hypothetical protein